MGILNVTPDSFSDGNRFFSTGAALDQALKLLDGGADLLDLGGESTRPDATPVTAEEEQSRMLPVLRAILKARPHAPPILSVDTYHTSTAQAALDAGAEIINDVSGLLWDSAMAGVLAREQAGAVLMHARGTPKTWKALPPLARAEVMPLVLSGLRDTVGSARAAGILDSHIVLDPGFGFGKLGDANFTLLAGFTQLQQLGLPLLAGVSRKRFLTAQMPHATEEDRLHATIAANVAAILSGAHILRVHDVPAACAAALVADSILSGA